MKSKFKIREHQQNENANLFYREKANLKEM